MAQKTFNDVLNEIKENISVSKTGKPVRTFSRSDFDTLAKAYLNAPDHTVEVVSQKAGELVKKEVAPVAQFRGMIRRILLDFGVDKQESERILSDSYEIRNVDGLYEVISDLVYQYAAAGKKFDFLTLEDFSGSLIIEEIGETISEHRAPGTDEKFKVKKKAHKQLKGKSKTPSWLKERLK